MKIYSRSINAGETFCTSIQNAKDVFETTDVKLCFGEFRRKYNPHKNEIGYGYYKRNIHGQVVANMILEPAVSCPLLKFYVVKSSSISNSMKVDFEKNVLYTIREIYNQFFIADGLHQRITVIWVELIDDKFHIHQFAS